MDIAVIDMPLIDTRRRDDIDEAFLANILLLSRVNGRAAQPAKVLQLMSFMAQNEYENKQKKQREGIEAARARGVRFGRPARDLPANFGELIDQWDRGKVPLCKILSETGLTKSTFYRRLKEFRGKNERVESVTQS